MKIAAVIVTCNRPKLLLRALKSVKEQSHPPDEVYLISNSTAENQETEQTLCTKLRIAFFQNHRTGNYAGALNTAIEEIVKLHGVKDNCYVATLDDDDEWLPEYLAELVSANDLNYDLLAAQYLRLSATERLMMTLPDQLSVQDFLIGNPGIGGSNTFIRLKTLLKAGSFDEAFQSAVDRDFMVRVFQQKPSYKIIPKHLVTAHTNLDRERLTTNREKKVSSLKTFLYKHQHLISVGAQADFFHRAEELFSIQAAELRLPEAVPSQPRHVELRFSNKGAYQFVIGFIAGNSAGAECIVEQIAAKKIPVDLVLIIEDVPHKDSLKSCENELKSNAIPYTIIRDPAWKNNLQSGVYGTYFQQFNDINSIPLGRTILHHHLFTETLAFEKPVFWIIDDDVQFRSLIKANMQMDPVDVFDIINAHINQADALIGGMSKDPPVPLLSCIRSQLVDYAYSMLSRDPLHGDLLAVKGKPDYYYDLSDLHTDHLETPVYHKKTSYSDHPCKRT